MLELIALGATTLIPLMLLWRRPFGAFLAVVLLTEFYYIEVGSGFARPYHFVAVLVIVLLFRHVPRLVTSRVFIGIIVFVVVNLLAIILADRPDRALGSFGLFLGNVAVAMATALILTSGKVTPESFCSIVIGVTTVSVAWGLIQIFASRVAGITLALSEMQESQIRLGFGPAFRTEANAFGKFMTFPVLLLLPEYIRSNASRRISRAFIVFLVGILMNFTRTSIYGMGLAFALISFWYFWSHQLRQLTSGAVKIGVAAALGVAVFGFVGVSEYAQHKMDNLFNEEEIREGGSSGYRLQMMNLILDDAVSDPKKTLIGNGWAQTLFYVNGREVRAGGGDSIAVLGYAGVLGVLAYLLYTWMAVTAAARAVNDASREGSGRFAEGVLFALFGLFMVAQMAGLLIAPEYWVVIGMTMFLSAAPKRFGVSPGAKRS